MRGMTPWFGVVLVMATAGCLAAEAGDDQVTVTSRLENYVANYHINDDLTDVVDIEYQVRVLDRSKLDDVKNTEISYSSSVQRVEIVEAYTLKADGRRVPVPPGNYQEKANTGHGGNGPVFSDYATMGLVYPDVAVGDAVHIDYRIVQTEPIFPGQFEEADVFYRSNAEDDVRIVIDAPASLKARYEVRGMEQSVEERDGRRILTMTWKNPQPVREKRRDWSVFDESAYPGYSYSTFDSYEAVARAYGARALPKAVPTEQVRKLAREITKGVKDRREKARLLYEWVARNITYAGNCVGVGSVVPHDTDFIVNNRMGDCKDHATLLQALLAAQGIKATQALVNASSVYALPKIPRVSAANHVINYLPEFDLFLDSTSSETPFGYLPQQVAGKPVLLVENYRDGMHAPTPGYAVSHQELQSELEFLPDGTARGQVKVAQAGLFAVESRARARDVTPEQIDEHMHKLYDNEGRKGFGKLTADDAKPLTDSYHFDVKFERPATITLPGAGGLMFFAYYRSGAGIDRFVRDDSDIQDGQQVACHGGVSEETHVLRMPAGTTIFAIPDDVHIAGDDFRYDATYRRDGTTVTAHRVLEDRTAGPLCSAAQQRADQVFSRRVRRDLRAQVVYQLKDTSPAP